jgi:DMSO/TMAO reductase YedYZ heme-binding membrane subunit
MLGVLMIHIVMDIFEITISMVNYLLYVIIIMLIYGIKIIQKMPIILTPRTRPRTVCPCAESTAAGSC